MPTQAERTQYLSELSTLDGQITTKKGQLDSAATALESARNTWGQRRGELEVLEQKAQERRIWISG